MFDWLIYLADKLVYDAMGLSPESHWGAAVHFFFYDSVKIFILLFVVTVLMGVVNAYLPIERLRNFLANNKLYKMEYLFAALFGAITPFCSCSSVPLFIGFVRGGIPLGVTLSFLITSPLVNEVAIAIFLSMFGWQTTLIYASVGILMGAVGGLVIGQMRPERWLSPWVKELIVQQQTQIDEKVARPTLRQQLPEIMHEAWSILKRVSPYVVIGIGVGALMHGFIPTDYLEQYMNKGNVWAVPIAVILAVPLYSNAAGVLPVLQVLVAKGVPLGTAIAFMMSVIGLSLPEATLLKKVMGWRLIIIFFAVVTAFIILAGYLFNIIF